MSGKSGHWFPAYGMVREPNLRFHPERPGDVATHPLMGLVDFGPFSSATLGKVLNPIRVGAIAPAGGLPAVSRLMRELEASHQPRERRQYLIDYPGFARVFRTRLVQADPGALVEFPADIARDLERSKRPWATLAERVSAALGRVDASKSGVDVVVLYLPKEWEAGFRAPAGSGEDFDLHDYIKSISAARSFPVQIVNDDDSGALSYYCRCSVAWRLGIALYTKAGGVPWTLETMDDRTAFVGVSYAVRGTDGSYVTCCSQVFDADGAGLEFIAYDVSAKDVDMRNPFLSREDMRRVMARSLALYQRRHAGRTPARVVVHKTSAFTGDEVSGCFDAWSGVDALELIEVRQNSAWRGGLVNRPRAEGGKGEPASYPIERGAYVQLGGRHVLAWTQGNVPQTRGNRQYDYFKEGKGTPSPL